MIPPFRRLLPGLYGGATTVRALGRSFGGIRDGRVLTISAGPVMLLIDLRGKAAD